jgi:four helix bundle protein
MNEAKETRSKAFEDLHVYQQAHALVNEVYSLTRRSAFARDRSLVDQVRRAAVSILSNIAEGFERGSNPEFIQFLYIAKGSAGEVRAQLSVARTQGYIEARDYEKLANQARLIGGMIGNFIAYLRGSRLRGPKHTPVRDVKAEEFDKELRRYWTPPGSKPEPDSETP